MYPKDHLLDDGRNLALVLDEVRHREGLERMEKYLNRFSDRFQKINVRLDGAAQQIYLREERLQDWLPAMRLSDGTLRFMCLMAILLDPNAGSLVCIEEPEVGLHPDAVRIVGEALAEASERMQLIVTTHSEALVDSFSDQPESVVVCENEAETGTKFRRLTREGLEGWLDRYSLGELWQKGQIGGNIA